MAATYGGGISYASCECCSYIDNQDRIFIFNERTKALIALIVYIPLINRSSTFIRAFTFQFLSCMDICDVYSSPWIIST